MERQKILPKGFLPNVRALPGRKVVIWEEAWAHYAKEFEARLGKDWEVVAGAGNKRWLENQLHDATALVALRIPSDSLAHARNLRLFVFPGAGLLTSDPGSFPAGCAVVNVYEHEGP